MEKRHAIVFKLFRFDSMRYLIFFIVLTMACAQPHSPTRNIEQRWWTEADRSHILSELDRTTDALSAEIASLSTGQWNFHENNDRWSIAEIVEHLEIQNQLHYREISVLVNGPQLPELRSITEGMDSHFTKYATDTIKGQAQWFLQPLGRFCSKAEGENAFYRARGELRNLVEHTDRDLRKQFTYRAPMDEIDITELKIGQVRDLHQLLLTGIAHTDRHLLQIRNIKAHPAYPR